MDEEQKRVDEIAERSRYAEGLNTQTTRYSFSIFERYFRPGSILELGPAEGVMTECLCSKSHDLSAVEGSALFCESLRERFPQVKVINALFEEFKPEQTYDNIILGHVLEHIKEPVLILSKVKGWLAPAGRVFSAVPNARSLHRQAAVIMGLLEHEKQLNDNDLYHGHRRVYDAETFRADFIAAGLKVEHFGGYWIKPLSNQQIEQSWTEQMVDAFMLLGESYPDIAAELFIVAGR
jgi:2-polyprenyl-3-methyl-5-hydroxy-6-metoxy-1,4-benzoquinol methylase